MKRGPNGFLNLRNHLYLNSFIKLFIKNDTMYSTTLQSNNFIKYQQLTNKISNHLNLKKRKKKLKDKHNH